MRPAAETPLDRRPQPEVEDAVLPEATAGSTSDQAEDPQQRPSGLGRAVALTAGASTLVPVIGLVSQPLLSHALGADGRGEVQAAIAPGLLLASLAALGLPEAVTYYVAKHPHFSRRAVAWGTAVVAGLGALGCGIGYLAVGYLSGGDAGLASVILLALVLTVPAMVMAVVKGAALGHQLWGLAALESVVSASLRLAVLVALWATGHLTVLSVVLVGTLGTLLTTAIYVRPLLRQQRLLAGHPAAGTQDDDHHDDDAPTPRRLVAFGSRVWFGSVASVLITRADQILMVPLASPTDLGLYSVAITISDAPIVLIFAVSGALFGVNSRSSDVDEVAATSRFCVLLSGAGCLVLALGVGFFVQPLFGADFGAAAQPSRLLLLAQFLVVPAIITGTGLATQGRPGLRSAALGLVLVLNIALILLLVPAYGVYGACYGAIACNATLTLVSVYLAGRIMHRPMSAFLVPRVADVRALVTGARALLARLRSRHTDRRTELS